MKCFYKKMQLFLIATVFTGMGSFAQNYYPAIGPVAFGTPTAPTPTNFSLQLHGTTDYIVSERGGGGALNYGKTSALHLTNLNTGLLTTDGMLMRMSAFNFTMKNQEGANIALQTNRTNFIMAGSMNRIFAGLGGPTTDIRKASFNVEIKDDNGLYIRTIDRGNYGLSIRSADEADNAIQVMGTSGNDRNFAVTASGQVFARKYTTTLSDIPDYVFSPTYKLMPLSELRVYLDENSHLPNVPSAAEYAETGVDLGEMNRVLLEKVEELTLYILQLEDRLNDLEDDQE